MTASLLQKAAVLLGVWWPAVHSVPCGLSIHPENPVLPYGGSVTLNCSSPCANATDLKWESSVQGEIQNASGWTSANFVNITAWDFQPLCYRQSEGKPVSMPVYLYQFSPPEIRLASEIVAGRRHTIACGISSLKVSRQNIPDVSVSLTSGGRILNGTEGRPSVEYTSVAQFTQDGAGIRCEAQLKVGKEVLVKTANSTLKVSAPPHNASILSDVTTYKAGAKIVMMCRAEGKPTPMFSWDLPSTDMVEFSNHNRTVIIHSAQRSHNGTYRCHAQNTYGSDLAHVDLLYEGQSRSWVITVAVVVVVIVLVVAFFICYQCRK